MKRSTNDNGGGGNHSIQKAPSKSSPTCCRFYVCVCLCECVGLSVLCLHLCLCLCVCVCLFVSSNCSHSLVLRSHTPKLFQTLFAWAAHSGLRLLHAKLNLRGTAPTGHWDFACQLLQCANSFAFLLLLVCFKYIFIFLRVNKQNKKNME